MISPKPIRPPGVSGRAGQLIRDKRLWFCLIVYPVFYCGARWLAGSAAVGFLTGHAPLVFLVSFLLFLLTTACVALDLVRRVFGFKVQGRQLQLQEQEKERIRRDE